MRLVLALKDSNIAAQLFPIVFDSLVNRARNAATAHFLSSDCTHILFIDSDIEFNPEDVLKLIQCKERVVGGAYAQKWLNLQKVKETFSKDPVPEKPMTFCTNHSIHFTLPSDKDQTKIEVDYLTTGFMLIEHSVFTELIKKYPQRQYTNDVDGYMSADKNMFYNFFCVEINEDTNRFESEDYGFCRLWKSIGGHIYVIPDITLTHYGWFGFGCNLKHQINNVV
jgi:GT2 family glycosyltransferase